MQKAASIQQARDAQGAMKFANKYLPCIARLSFRLGKGLPPKFKKSLSESNATRIDDVMQRLNVATKQLQRVLQSNGETAAMASRCVGKKGSCMHDVKNSD